MPRRRLTALAGRAAVEQPHRPTPDDPHALPLLRPNWAMPAGVDAAMSLRAGGVSAAPYNSLNLSPGVGDDAAHVHVNRARLTAALSAQPVWMRHVHGAQVLHLVPGSQHGPLPTADAAWTSERGLACTVGAADCMPVLFSVCDGRAVAAAHAGWRGLAAGVLQATLRALCEGAGARPQDCQAWMGPCIGPRHFEVGADVLVAFGADPARADQRFFQPLARPLRANDGQPRWLADLPALARQQLLAAGVQRVADAGRCTYQDRSDFFSFRRDAVTGRHAAAIWRT